MNEITFFSPPNALSCSCPVLLGPPTSRQRPKLYDQIPNWVPNPYFPTDVTNIIQCQPIVFLPHVEWNNEFSSLLLENNVLTMNLCETQSIYISYLSQCRYGTMEVRQRIWLNGMRFWLLYTVQLLQSMKWLCEVRLGPIYSETQGSPHTPQC